MAEYKNIDAILKEIYRRANRSSLGEITVPHLDWKELVSVIKDAPTADVVEVKHGKWIKPQFIAHCGFYEVKEFKCSVCGKVYEVKQPCNLMNYCNYCGAKMDRGDNE